MKTIQGPIKKQTSNTGIIEYKGEAIFMKSGAKNIPSQIENVKP